MTKIFEICQIPWKIVSHFKNSKENVKAYFHVLNSLDSCFYELIFLLDSWTRLFKSDPTMVSLFLLSYPEQSFYGMLCSWKVLACTGNSSKVCDQLILLITPVLELTMSGIKSKYFAHLIFKRQNRVPMTGVLLHFLGRSLCKLANFLFLQPLHL